MSVQKKSLISQRSAVKSAILATPQTSNPAPTARPAVQAAVRTKVHPAVRTKVHPAVRTKVHPAVRTKVSTAVRTKVRAL